jgi:hypothetical protein
MSVETVSADVLLPEQSGDVRQSAPLYMTFGTVEYVRKDWADAAATNAQDSIIALQKDRDKWEEAYYDLQRKDGE